MTKKILTFFAIILGLLAAIGPRTIFPVCNGAMKMRCYNTAQAELIVGIAAVVIGAGLLFLRKKEIRVVLSILEGVAGLFILFIPTVIIGVCGSPMMHCVSVTKPVLIVLGILEIFSGVVISLLEVREVAVKTESKGTDFANT